MLKFFLDDIFLEKVCYRFFLNFQCIHSNEKTFEFRFGVIFLFQVANSGRQLIFHLKKNLFITLDQIALHRSIHEQPMQNLCLIHLRSI